MIQYTDTSVDALDKIMDKLALKKKPEPYDKKKDQARIELAALGSFRAMGTLNITSPLFLMSDRSRFVT